MSLLIYFKPFFIFILYIVYIFFLLFIKNISSSISHKNIETVRLLDFSLFLSSTLIYEPILTNKQKKILWLLTLRRRSMTSKVIQGHKGPLLCQNYYSTFVYGPILCQNYYSTFVYGPIFMKICNNANIMNTQSF